MNGQAQNTELVKTMSRNASCQSSPGLNSTLAKILLAAIKDKISNFNKLYSLFFVPWCPNRCSWLMNGSSLNDRKPSLLSSLNYSRIFNLWLTKGSSGSSSFQLVRRETKHVESLVEGFYGVAPYPQSTGQSLVTQPHGSVD